MTGACQPYNLNDTGSLKILEDFLLRENDFERQSIKRVAQDFCYNVKCLIINGSFENPIMFFKDKFNNYDCLTTLKQKNTCTAIRALVYQVFSSENLK